MVDEARNQHDPENQSNEDASDVVTANANAIQKFDLEANAVIPATSKPKYCTCFLCSLATLNLNPVVFYVTFNETDDNIAAKEFARTFEDDAEARFKSIDGNTVYFEATKEEGEFICNVQMRMPFTVDAGIVSGQDDD
jgi:hypothetical protein